MPTTEATVGGRIKKAKLKEFAIKATREMERLYFMSVPEEGKGGQVQEVENFFVTARFLGDSSLRREMAQFASILLGVEIKLKTPQRITYSRLAVVVPTGNTNGHDYEIGKPVMMLGGCLRGLKTNGTHGYDLPATLDDVFFKLTGSTKEEE